MAIVDAYDGPSAEADLAVYRSQYGLSACTTANGCFKKTDQNGSTEFPRGNSGWAGDLLDLDMVSAALSQLQDPAGGGRLGQHDLSTAQ